MKIDIKNNPSPPNQLLEQYFYLFAQNCRDVFWIRSADYKQQLYVSPSFERIWGIDCNYLIQNPDDWIKFIHPEDLIHIQPSIKARNPTTSEDYFSQVYRIIRPNGQIRWIRDHSAPILDENNKIQCFIGIAQDITEDKRREGELFEAKQLAEAGLHAKSEFIANMSHDIRTPLSGIIGIAEILQAHANDDEQKKLTEELILSSQNLLNLLNEILEASKIERNELSARQLDFDLRLVVSAVINLIKPSVRNKGLQLYVNFDAEIPNILLGDPIIIHRILLNLLSNAVKFTEKGYIELTIQCLNKRNDQNTLQMIIKDTGIGIPKEKMNSLFKRFSRVDHSYEGIHRGAGLGLYIVKEFIDCIHGSISVQSTLGVGTTFTCLVDLATADKNQPSPHSTLPNIPVTPNDSKHEGALPNSSLNPATSHSLHVLLIEDDKIAQNIAAIKLKECGCSFDIANNCQSAYAQYQQNHYDLILMDIGLPDGNGFILAQQIRAFEKSQLRTATPIVALTAHIDEEHRREFELYGFNAVYSKPLSYDLLKNIIQASYLEQP